MKPNTKIGIARIEYNEDGTVKSAIFEPTMKVEAKADTLSPFLSIEDGNSSEEAVKEHAIIALATWFNKMNEIELADREKYTIDTEVVSCEKYPSGSIKICQIEFHFEELKPSVKA